MKLRIPQHSEYGIVLIEILGPDVHRRIEAFTAVCEIERHFDIDERLLSVTACFMDNGGKQVGETFVLKEAEPVDLEPVDLEPADVEPADVEPIDLEPIDLEPIDVEPTDVEPTKKAEELPDEIVEVKKLPPRRRSSSR